MDKELTVGILIVLILILVLLTRTSEGFGIKNQYHSLSYDIEEYTENVYPDGPTPYALVRLSNAINPDRRFGDILSKLHHLFDNLMRQELVHVVIDSSPSKNKLWAMPNRFCFIG